MKSKLNPKLKLVEAAWPAKSPRIALVGEAPGEQEALEGKPFVGSSGHLLDELLKMAGLARDEMLVTNVFQERPPKNDVSFFFENNLRVYAASWESKRMTRPVIRRNLKPASKSGSFLKM